MYAIRSYYVLIIATAVETGPVDDTHFQHPEGFVAAVDAKADAMAEQMARQAIAMLKDSKAASA